MRLDSLAFQILKITHTLDFVTNPLLQRIIGHKETPKGTGRQTGAKRQLDKLVSAGLLIKIEIAGKSLMPDRERFYYVLSKDGSRTLGLDHKPMYRPRRPSEWMHDHFVNDCLLTFYQKYSAQAGLPFEVIRNLKFKHADRYIQPDACFIVDNKYTFILEIERSRDERKIYKDKIIPQSQIKDFTPYKVYQRPGQKEPDKIREPFKRVTFLYVIAHGDNDLFERPWQITEQEKASNTGLMHKVIAKTGKTDRFLFAPAHFFDILHLNAWTRGQGYQPLIQKIKF